jgi:TonB family protein
VNIDFVKPATSAPSEAPAAQPSIISALTAIPSKAPPPPPPPPPPPTSGKLDHIVVTGLSDAARSELLSSLPIQEDGEWTGQMFAAVKEAAAKFDSHLTVGLGRSASGELTLNISVANSGMNARPLGAGRGFGFAAGIGAAPPVPALTTPPPPGVYSVGNGVSPPSVLSKTDPAYPEGEPAGLAATVMLSIVVGTDGTPEDIKVVKSADASFDANAIAALSKWVFKPGMMNGVPVKVRAQVEINFRKL